MLPKEDLACQRPHRTKNHSRSLYSQKSALTKYIRVVRWTRNLNIPVEPGFTVRYCPKYPLSYGVQTAKIQGNVLVSFIVEKDGSVSDVTAVKKVHANLNTEAIRVVKSLKKWTPGTKDGQPVRVQSAVYVTFSL